MTFRLGGPGSGTGPAPGPTVDGGSLVAEGLLTKPATNAGLFVRESRRLLAITGGTGPYNGARGSIRWIPTLRKLDVAYTLP